MKAAILLAALMVALGGCAPGYLKGRTRQDLPADLTKMALAEVAGTPCADKSASRYPTMSLSDEMHRQLTVLLQQQMADRGVDLIAAHEWGELARLRVDVSVCVNAADPREIDSLAMEAEVLDLQNQPVIRLESRVVNDLPTRRELRTSVVGKDKHVTYETTLIDGPSRHLDASMMMLMALNDLGFRLKLSLDHGG